MPTEILPEKVRAMGLLRMAIADQLVKVEKQVQSYGLHLLNITLIARDPEMESAIIVVIDENDEGLRNACAQAAHPDRINPTFNRAGSASKVAHTSGPWRRIIGVIGDGRARSQEEQLCSQYGLGAMMIQHDGSAEGNANAQLMVTAPDLLRENIIAAESLRHIASQMTGADYVRELANDIRMVAVNLENVARKAQGESR